LDQDRRRPPGVLAVVGREIGALLRDEGGHVPAGTGNELVDPLELALEGLLRARRVRQAAGDEEVPDLAEALLLALRGRVGRGRVVRRERRLRPLERREAGPRLLPVRDRERTEGAAVERALERDDEATVFLAV